MESSWELVINFTVAMLVIFSCSLILLFFLWLGRDLLLKLHIGLAGFKIGGGLILLQFGFSMMKGTAVDISEKMASETDNLRGQVLQRYQQILFPIGVPVIAGPGAITTVILYGHQSENLLTTILLSIALIAVLTLQLLILLSGTLLKRKMQGSI